MIHILSAAAFEAQPLMDAFNEHKIAFSFSALGIGPLLAAANVEKIKGTITGQHVIFLGTCGSFTPFKGIEIVRADQVYFSCPGERHNLSESVEICYPGLQLPKPFFGRELEKKHVLTSPSISLSSEITNKKLPYHSLKHELVENMEAYPLAAIAHLAASFSSFLAITNQLCPDARIQWRKHFKEAALLTSNYIFKNYINIINGL